MAMSASADGCFMSWPSPPSSSASASSSTSMCDCSGRSWLRRLLLRFRQRGDNSGRIGLLGFSLGGFIAADTAAHDERVEASGVLYGGMPNATVSQVKHLPPVLELHGDADRNVPLHENHIGLEYADSIAETLPKLRDACDKAGIALPASFLKFM